MGLVAVVSYDEGCCDEDEEYFRDGMIFFLESTGGRPSESGMSEFSLERP